MNNSLLYWNSPKSCLQLTSLLQNENIALSSTDTIYGLLANLSPKSYKKLSAIKGQRENKPYLVLIASPDKISCFIDSNTLTPKLKKLIESCWPGPVTIIFKAKKELPSHMISQKKTIALRCPDHDGLRTILKKFDGLFSTSANKSNQSAPHKFDDISPEIVNAVSSIMLDELTIEKNLSSTIIDCTNLPTITLLRQGAYPLSILERNYGQAFKK